MNIGFFVRHFTETGTEVAIYDYAQYNEKLLNNNSYIICFTENTQRRLNFPSTRASYEKFKSRFPIIEINAIQDMIQVIKDYNLSFFYTLTHGMKDVYQFDNKDIWGSCKTIKHCVFHTTYPESDFYISIGDSINKLYNTNIPIIPHIVCLPDESESLRTQLHIPEDAIVIGRHGGHCHFDIQIAHDAIIEFLNTNTNTYFLFMNTNVFYTHPRIIYLDRNVDLVYKTKFINTCDAMIHGRKIGESFGLAIAEFSSKNKPVITYSCGDLEHIRILGDKGIIYNSREELVDIFNNLKSIIASKNDWNAYTQYTPENIMRLFKELIFDKH